MHLLMTATNEVKMSVMMSAIDEMKMSVIDDKWMSATDELYIWM